MSADFTIKQGDTAPGLADTLSFSNGEAVNLEGATLKFVMRNMTFATPVTLTGTASITEAAEGKVSYLFSASDTASIGNYAANWLVTFASGKKMTFPTIGYLWIEVQENLTTTGTGTLVPLGEVKDYLSIEANDRTHDMKLIRYINAVRPIIENITGPILPQVYRETFDGGQYFVSLRRRPSTTFGTTPIFRLIACSEWRGPIEYDLSIIATPAQGTIYSCLFHKRQGIVERRTSGGGVMAFPKMASSVLCVYEAGQETVPYNVQEAALETIRINWATTQMVGSGRQTVADTEEVGNPAFGVFLPRRVREMLAPNRRGPSIY